MTKRMLWLEMEAKAGTTGGLDLNYKQWEHL